MVPTVCLFDGYFGAADGFAGEEADFASSELHYAIFGCMDSVVAADKCAFAGTLRKTSLAYNDLARANLFATK